MLSILTIDRAMKGNEFWLGRGSDAERIVIEAGQRGYIKRLSWTQAQWTDAGLAKARRELPEETGHANAAHDDAGAGI